MYPVQGGEPIPSNQNLIVKLIEHKAKGLGLHSRITITQNIYHNTQVIRTNQKNVSHVLVRM